MRLSDRGTWVGVEARFRVLLFSKMKEVRLDRVGESAEVLSSCIECHLVLPQVRTRVV